MTHKPKTICHQTITTQGCNREQMPLSDYCYKHTLEYLEKYDRNRVNGFRRRNAKQLKADL